jgi:hypothetical protein
MSCETRKSCDSTVRRAFSVPRRLEDSARFFSAVSSAFNFKVCKKCKYGIHKNIVYKNAVKESKHAEFDADFRSVEKFVRW